MAVDAKILRLINSDVGKGAGFFKNITDKYNIKNDEGVTAGDLLVAALSREDSVRLANELHQAFVEELVKQPQAVQLIENQKLEWERRVMAGEVSQEEMLDRTLIENSVKKLLGNRLLRRDSSIERGVREKYGTRQKNQTTLDLGNLSTELLENVEKDLNDGYQKNFAKLKPEEQARETFLEKDKLAQSAMIRPEEYNKERDELQIELRVLTGGGPITSTSIGSKLDKNYGAAGGVSNQVYGEYTNDTLKEIITDARGIAKSESQDKHKAPDVQKQFKELLERADLVKELAPYTSGPVYKRLVDARNKAIGKDYDSYYLPHLELNELTTIKAELDKWREEEREKEKPATVEAEDSPSYFSRIRKQINELGKRIQSIGKSGKTLEYMESIKSKVKRFNELRDKGVQAPGTKSPDEAEFLALHEELKAIDPRLLWNPKASAIIAKFAEKGGKLSTSGKFTKDELRDILGIEEKQTTKADDTDASDKDESERMKKIKFYLNKEMTEEEVIEFGKLNATEEELAIASGEKKADTTKKADKNDAVKDKLKRYYQLGTLWAKAKITPEEKLEYQALRAEIEGLKNQFTEKELKKLHAEVGGSTRIEVTEAGAVTITYDVAEEKEINTAVKEEAEITDELALKGDAKKKSMVQRFKDYDAKEFAKDSGNFILGVIGWNNFQKGNAIYEANAMRLGEDATMWDKIDGAVVKEYACGTLKSLVVAASIASGVAAAGSAVAAGTSTALTALRATSLALTIADTVVTVRETLDKNISRKDKKKAVAQQIARVTILGVATVLGACMSQDGVAKLTESMAQSAEQIGDGVEKVVNNVKGFFSRAKDFFGIGSETAAEAASPEYVAQQAEVAKYLEQPEYQQAITDIANGTVVTNEFANVDEITAKVNKDGVVTNNAADLHTFMQTPQWGSIENSWVTEWSQQTGIQVGDGYVGDRTGIIGVFRPDLTLEEYDEIADMQPAFTGVTQPQPHVPVAEADATTVETRPEQGQQGQQGSRVSGGAPSGYVPEGAGDPIGVIKTDGGPVKVFYKDGLLYSPSWTHRFNGFDLEGFANQGAFPDTVAEVRRFMVANGIPVEAASDVTRVVDTAPYVGAEGAGDDSYAEDSSYYEKHKPYPYPLKPIPKEALTLGQALDKKLEPDAKYLPDTNVDKGPTITPEEFEQKSARIAAERTAEETQTPAERVRRERPHIPCDIRDRR